MKKSSKKKSVNLRGGAPFQKGPKKPGADVSPYKARPAAHAPKQAAQAKRMKRLSGVML
jgi:hypothetical protein